MSIFNYSLSRRNIYNFVIFIFVMATGITLRMFDLSSKSFWGDELLSIWHAQDIVSLKTFFSPLQGNAHPPLYFLLLKFWSFGGDGEFYLRLLSVIFGILVIPATYLLGRQFFDQKISLIGAFLVAISPLHMLYDREVRMYSLFTLLTIISLYFFIRALKEGKTNLWVGYTVFTVLNTFTHYHAFLIILFEWIFFIVRFKYYKYLIKKAIMSQVIIAICFSFWLPAFFFHLRNLSPLGGGWTRFPIKLGAWIKPVYLFYSFSVGQTVSPWNYIVVISALMIFSVLFILGIKNMLKNNEMWHFFLMALFIPIIAGLFISDMMPRYFLFIAPIYTLIIAKGISTFSKPKIQVISIGIIVILLGFSLKNYYTNQQFHIMAHVDPWREVGHYLKENVKKNDIVFNVGGLPINHYSGLNIPVLEKNALPMIKESIQNNSNNFISIWLIISNPAYKSEGEESVKWFSDQFSLISEKKFYGDVDYLKKGKLFNKNFLEHRIRVFHFGNEKN